MKFKLLFIIILIVFLLFYFSSPSFAADPKLISKIKSSFEKIKDWLVKLSTPAVAVSIGTGVFMKKFSFGDEERLRIGKKLIRTSLFSYIFILLLDLILSTIQNLLID